MPDLQRIGTSDTSTEGSKTHESEDNGVGHGDSTTSTAVLGFVIVVKKSHACSRRCEPTLVSVVSQLQGRVNGRVSAPNQVATENRNVFNPGLVRI